MPCGAYLVVGVCVACGSGRAVRWEGDAISMVYGPWEAFVRHSRGGAQSWQTGGDIERHVELIRRQINVSLEDPSTRLLASAIVSGNFDSRVDPRTGGSVPVVPYHDRWYRGAADWVNARALCAMRDSMCEVTAIWNFVVLNIRYTGDQDGEDTYQSLRATLEMGAGDCDDMTIAFAALLKSIGFEHIVARIISLDGRSWAHIYPIVSVPRVGAVALDATEPGKLPGWEFRRPAAKRDFIL